MDARGNLTEEYAGNGVKTMRAYDPESGYLQAIRSFHPLNTTTLKYAPDHSRYYRQDSTGSGTTTYTYMDGLYEKVTLPNGQTEERHYLGDIAILTIKNRTATVPGTQQRRYLHQDHLGSVTVITDDYADIVEKFSFDPWGKRRAPNLQTLEQKLGAWNSLSAYQKSNLTLSALTLASTTTNQGFTGHEQMDPVGLIHMGGRVYDAEIGRFISADPFVDDTTNLQALNRYSYVYNNPLSYTDPSGYGFFSSAFKLGKKIWNLHRSAFKKAWKETHRPLKQLARAISKVEGLQQVVSVALAVACGPCAMAFNAAMTVANGGSIGDVLTGLAVGLVTNGLAQGIADQLGAAFNISDAAMEAAVEGVKGATKSAIAAVATGQAIASGVMSKAMGGKFVDGVKGAATGMALTYGMQRIMAAGEGKAEATEINVPEDTKTTIELRHKRIIEWLGPLSPKHAYVIVTDHTTGLQTVYRGGPELNLFRDGTFGNIEAVHKLYTVGAPDWTTSPASSQIVLQTDVSASVYNAQLTHFANQVNSAAIPYRLFSQNSNSFAYQALESVGIPRPSHQGFAPASQSVLAY